MTTEERDTRLTAYALDDPGLSAAERQEIEAALTADPAARQAFEETRKLAALLTTGLAAEQAALPAVELVTIPSTLTPKPRRRLWKMLTIAATVMIAVFGGAYVLYDQTRPEFQSTIANRDVAMRGDEAKQDADWKLTARQRALRDGPMASLESSTAPSNEQRPGYLVPPAGGMVQSVTPLAQPPQFGAPANPGIPGTGSLPGQGMGMPGMPGGRDATTGGYPGGLAPGEPGRSWRGSGFDSIYVPGGEDKPTPNDRYSSLIENSFVTVAGQDALSTFGVDVDTASYSIVRKYLTMGQLPPADSVRLEELVNYFPYADKAPEGDDPFAVTVELAECPWAPKHRLARIGLKAKPIDTDKRPPSNIVFLVDVSGSMNEPNKLPLVQASLRMLVNQLGENDRVAMVVYAGAAGLVLDSTSATKKDVILAALDRLQAGGSTNGAGGLQQAYDVAVANFIKNGTNRVILCTDGDWNVGTTGTADLVKLIEEKRKTGVFLSVFGFGMGNLRDEMMVQLAGKGNGNYGYIDTLKEANKALVEQLGGTLVTVAKDVKIQVEFNPSKVQAYRLLGYEKRRLAAKDFHDDKKDAGEMGAGHVVTALYELVPAGEAMPKAGQVDGLRYQRNAEPKPVVKAGNLKESFVVKMRHKKPDSDTSTLRELPVTDPGKGYGEASEDFQFAASVASFAMLLRDSPYKGEATFALVKELAESAKKHDPGEYRAEFLELVKRAKQLSGKP